MKSAQGEVYTVGFVPSYLLPDRGPNAMDPFLEPLVADLENSFIEGNLAFVLFSFSFKRCLCSILTDTIKLMDGYEKEMKKCFFLQQI